MIISHLIVIVSFILAYCEFILGSFKMCIFYLTHFNSNFRHCRICKLSFSRVSTIIFISFCPSFKFYVKYSIYIFLFISFVIYNHLSYYVNFNFDSLILFLVASFFIMDVSYGESHGEYSLLSYYFFVIVCLSLEILDHVYIVTVCFI